MVKIAVAGGSGRATLRIQNMINCTDFFPAELAQEVIDTLIAANKHQITILTRNASAKDNMPGVTWLAVNYNDKDGLVSALQGIHTVLSFTNQQDADDENNAQKNLIDASIAAGVSRFAPSEYGR